MDIRDWPLDQIMQLPDHCFGRRWPIVTSRNIAPTIIDEWLVKTSVPDKCVLWELSATSAPLTTLGAYCKFALGDHEPANDAEFNAFERIIQGDLDNATMEGAIYADRYCSLTIRMKNLLLPQGRRFAVQAHNPHATTTVPVTFFFIISSIPTEVPDWLLSAHP